MEYVVAPILFPVSAFPKESIFSNMRLISPIRLRSLWTKKTDCPKQDDFELGDFGCYETTYNDDNLYD